MKFIRRKDRLEAEKNRRRIKIAFFFLLLILSVSGLGLLVRTYQQSGFSFLGNEGFLVPGVEKSREKEFAEEFKKAKLELVSLSVSGEKEIEASLSGGTKVLFKTEEISQQVSSLQVLLSRFKIEGRRPKIIDLRFEKPIIVF